MKRFLLFFCSISYFIAFTSCEKNIIDGIQHIQGPGDCLKCNNVSWEVNNVTLYRTTDSYIQFKALINGTLKLEYYNFYHDVYGAGNMKIFVDKQQVGDFKDCGNTSKIVWSNCHINNIKKGQIIKIGWFNDHMSAPDMLNSTVQNIQIINGNFNPNPDWDF